VGARLNTNAAQSGVPRGKQEIRCAGKRKAAARGLSPASGSDFSCAFKQLLQKCRAVRASVARGAFHAFNLVLELKLASFQLSQFEGVGQGSVNHVGNLFLKFAVFAFKFGNVRLDGHEQEPPVVCPLRSHRLTRL
jgi:hypothetical protein